MHSPAIISGVRLSLARAFPFLASGRGTAVALLAFAIAFNAVTLLPEVAYPSPPLNDDVLHLALLQGASTALSQGDNVTDFWLPQIALGYPVLHYYQHLPYVAIALLHHLTFKLLSLELLFHLSQYLLLSLYPLAVYWAARRFGFQHLPSALAGLLAPLLSTDGLYGLEYGSYVWRGYGLYTQLWAMLLLPLCWAQLYVTIREGKGYFLSVVLLAATLLSHLVYGYIAILTAIAFLFLQPHLPEIWRRAKRLALVFLPVAVVVSYFVLPLLLDSQYLNRSVWLTPSKYDSLGHGLVLKTLLSGNLLDFGRLPALSLLLMAGLGIASYRFKDEKHRALVVLFFVWLLLYFGRPTWGVLFNLLPLTRDLQLHRFIGGVQLAATFLLGTGLAAIWGLARKGPRPWALLGGSVLTLALLLPVYWERAQYLRLNSQWMKENNQAFLQEQKDLDSLLAALRGLPPRRVYSGLGANWGKDYRVGYVPLYALYPVAGIDSLGYLYHFFSLNADVQVLFNEELASHYDLFNVGYAVLPADRVPPAFLRRIGQFGRHVLYAAPTSGFFGLVDSDIALVGGKGDWYKAASQWLQSPLLEARQHPSIFFGWGGGDYPALLPMDRADAPTLELAMGMLPERPPAGRVTREEVLGQTYGAEVTVERASYLMLKVTYHPNWRASVDGVEVETVMLAPSYVGVKMAPGTHTVRVEYRPQPFRWYLMLLGILVLPLVDFLEWRQRRAARLAKSQ